jgi:hypothetical protein
LLNSIAIEKPFRFAICAILCGNLPLQRVQLLRLVALVLV